MIVFCFSQERLVAGIILTPPVESTEIVGPFFIVAMIGTQDASTALSTLADVVALTEDVAWPIILTWPCGLKNIVGPLNGRTETPPDGSI